MEDAASAVFKKVFNFWLQTHALFYLQASALSTNRDLQSTLK
jgi:hypothetical protein